MSRTTTGNCPCQSGADYRDCCRPYHKGKKKPPTAEILMRSRFCAFAKDRVNYLLETWHSSTRPPQLQLDRAVTWTGLEITATHMGAENDVIGTVTFTARYTTNGMPGAMTETSDFVRQDGRWFYVKGDVQRT